MTEHIYNPEITRAYCHICSRVAIKINSYGDPVCKEHATPHTPKAHKAHRRHMDCPCGSGKKYKKCCYRK